MTDQDQEVLGRFHRALVREIQASNPDYLSSPFTVAEIYQNLIPYRTHREELGVEMNGDYEHALLRLLAGEGDYLTIESRTARQEIREELDSPNPNTGLYRDFAAADVRLNPEMVDEALGWTEAEEDQAGEESHGVELVAQHGFDAEELMAVERPAESPDEDELQEEEAEAMEESFPLDAGGVEDEGEGGPAEEDIPEEVDSTELPLEVTDQDSMAEADSGEAASTEPEASGPDTCPWCRENLPRRPGVSFCPFCGSNVKLVPCPACGEELELNWRFCVACGTEVAS